MLATHTPTGELVAIKILEKSKMLSEADVTRVTREINILKQVKHPNIAQLYQIIETPNKICLVLEYLERGELYDMIVRHKKLKEADAARYFLQLLHAVQHMHSHGVSHRDLKPENLLLDDKYNLKVIDFGLSNYFNDVTLLKTSCGSPCYAAPEMVAGLHYSGEKVDMWSCGIVLFAMTVGKLPFDDPSAKELYRKIISGRFSFPSGLTEELKDLINGLLRTEPSDRFDIETSMNSAWIKAHANMESFQDLQTVHPIVLNQIRELGLDAKYTQQCLESNKHNQLTTAYFLMLKKMVRGGFVPRLEAVRRRLSPNILVKSQTTRAYTHSNRRGSLITTKTEEELPLEPTTKTQLGLLRTRFKQNKPQPQPPQPFATSRPSISPARRVFKPAENKQRGLTPRQPSRSRSTSQTRSQSLKRSTSNSRSGLLALKRSTLVESASVCWTSNKDIREVTAEVMTGLDVLKFNYQSTNEGFAWEYQQVSAELSMKRLGTLTIVKCNLLVGPVKAYREYCSRLLCSINL